MDTFFVLNISQEISVPVKFNGSIFLYKQSPDTLIAAKQIQLIEKLILNGLKLEMDEILLLDLNAHKIRFKDINKETKIKNCILFGDVESLFGLNFEIPKYVIKLISEVQFLKADTAEILDTNAALKTKFWTVLKNLFNID